jgi:hypothetical protein
MLLKAAGGYDGACPSGGTSRPTSRLLANDFVRPRDVWGQLVKPDFPLEVELAQSLSGLVEDDQLEDPSRPAA